MKLRLCVVGLCVAGVAFAALLFRGDGGPSRHDGAVPPLSETAQDDGTVTVWEQWLDLAPFLFNEPYEVLVVGFRDATLLFLSTHEDRRINVPAAYICERVRESGRDISDAVFVAHSHPLPGPISMPDRLVFLYLVEQGFTGAFGVYVVPTRTWLFIGK